MAYQKSSEWYTPSIYIEAARSVMGYIELDPASSDLANETVKATRYYTAQENGLEQDWLADTVYINPPYSNPNGTTGREGSREGLTKPFVMKLINEYKAGNVKEAILCVTSDTDASWFYPLWEYPICFTHKKVYFDRPGLPKAGQFFGTVFVYLGEHEDRFRQVFSQFGTVAKRVERKADGTEVLISYVLLVMFALTISILVAQGFKLLISSAITNEFENSEFTVTNVT